MKITCWMRSNPGGGGFERSADVGEAHAEAASASAVSRATAGRRDERGVITDRVIIVRARTLSGLLRRRRDGILRNRQRLLRLDHVVDEAAPGDAQVRVQAVRLAAVPR